MSKYEDYLMAKKIRERAEEWNKLHDYCSCYNDPFSMCIGSYKLQLIKSDRKPSEDKNSWKTDEKLAKAMLREIKGPWIISTVIEELKEKENQALKECKEYAQNILEEWKNEKTQI